MRTVIIILSVLILTLPAKANAGDRHRDEWPLMWIGAPAALVTAFITPLIGLAINGRENQPSYWRVVGFTALGSSAGAGITYLNKDHKSDDEKFGDYVFTPLLFGAVATYLTYRFSSPKTDKTSIALWKYAPQVSVSPVARGGSIRLNWSF